MEDNNKNLRQLTEDEQTILIEWSDLDDDDKQVIRNLINHISRISLDRKGQGEFLKSKGYVDLARTPRK